jgi:hypothetical protein
VLGVPAIVFQSSLRSVNVIKDLAISHQPNIPSDSDEDGDPFFTKEW